MPSQREWTRGKKRTDADVLLLHVEREPREQDLVAVHPAAKWEARGRRGIGECHGMRSDGSTADGERMEQRWTETNTRRVAGMDASVPTQSRARQVPCGASSCGALSPVFVAVGMDGLV